MLSYRHAFHAGGYADVLKHWLLVEVLSYLNSKDSPWTYIDTHAGGSLTDFESALARKVSEYRDGIGKLWASRNAAPSSIAAYLALVEAFNSRGKLRWYPSSGMLAQRLARAQDRLHLFELHPADYASLIKCFHSRSVGHCYREDGLSGFLRLLPPPSRRGCILIDPSYEVKQEYARVAKALKAAFKRFPQGAYLIWYPLLADTRAKKMAEGIMQLATDNYLKTELRIRACSGMGLFGCGMIVLNPPWVLPERCQQTLPWLAKQLAQDNSAGYEVTYKIR